MFFHCVSSATCSPTSVLQNYFVLKGILYIIYSAVWFYYISALLDQSPSAPIKRCRDILPLLRTVLLILAWIKVFVMAFDVCVFVSYLLVQPSIDIFIVLIAYIIIFGIFVYQIQFLNAVEMSTTYNSECDAIETQKRQTVMSFNVVIFVFGVTMVAFGVSGQTMLEKLLPSKSNTKNRVRTSSTSSIHRASKSTKR